MWDDEEAAKPAAIIVGDSLERLSIEEITERIEALRKEIARCEKNLEVKKGSISAADSAFKL